MYKYKLITSIKQEKQHIDNICENVVVFPDTKLFFESADKYIGNIIAILNDKNQRNPFEAIPGSIKVLAGLILLAKETNREALNINPKKFSIVAQKTSEDKELRKKLALIADNSGPSLIANLKAYMADPDRRDVLKRDLYKLQNQYSRAKQQSKKDQNISKVVNA